MNHNIKALLMHVLGDVQYQDLVNLMHISPQFRMWEEGVITRAELAQALNMLLFAGILERVPIGRAYTQEVVGRGAKVMLDHGALRTVRWLGLGALPPGEAAITRILKPLGYRLNGVFPLDRLKMTGRSYVQVDDPENISQFFVSELHPERFSPAFQDAVTRVLADSTDPLSPAALSMLHELERDGRLSLVQAQILLANLRDCFERQHGIFSENDYEILLAESAEMAWIATEGNAFNHATDRVVDVFAVNEEQKRLGRPIKAEVEVSASGRVKQTAFKADMVTRQMINADGFLIERQVPGSFYEFITRDVIAEGMNGENYQNNQQNNKPRLDLGFDTSNAQAIFKMTANA
ncbi:DUF1338 domain-containing protein [Undibacterium sp. Ji22W]|uniref:DUF1338 domain-containing protein n=1 Tax=Undibacterium sp. Ji22W TaxID=3413038 RepID=UPI003BEF638E